MSHRTDLPSILNRALLATASARAQTVSRKGTSGDLFHPDHGEDEDPPDLNVISEQAHRFLADLISMLMLELEGIVPSPLNTRSRARVRLGAPSRSRLVAEWPRSEPDEPEAELFPNDASVVRLPSGRDAEGFFRAILASARSSAEFLHLDITEIEEIVRWLLPEIGRCDPEDDPVGWIHAHAQRHSLRLGPGNRLRFQIDRERGRSHGVLYTPPPLTEVLVQAILSTWRRPGETGSISLFESVGVRRGEPPQILDPSCGSGQFLLAIARHLLSQHKGRPEEILGIFNGLHGVDIDPAAASLSAFNLSLQAVRALCSSQGADPPTVVRWLDDRVGPGFPWFLGSQIHQGNALLLAATKDGKTFRWVDRFPEVFSRERPGFDIVIGNPPWVSYGMRDRAGPEAEESAYLRNLYAFGAQYKLSLYPLFIELGLRLARPGGLHGFLVPDSFFTGRHFSKIRAHLLEESRPILFCLVESGPWPGVHVGHTAFYCVRRLPAPGPRESTTTCVVQLPSPGRRPKKRAGTLLPSLGEGVTGTRPVKVDPTVFRSTPHQTFRIYREEDERRFVEQVERTPYRFGDLIETYSGLIARFGQDSVTGPRTGEFVLRDRSGEVLIRDPKPQNRWKPALHSGAEVEPFRTQWRGGTLYIPKDLKLLRSVYKSGFDLKRYAQPKIFLRQTGDCLVAARDAEGLYCLNNVHILTSGPDIPIDLRFLCGLLLSETIQRYYQVIAMEAGRPLAQVDLATVRTLPFPSDAEERPYGVIDSSEQGRRLAAEVAKQVDRALAAESIDQIGKLITIAQYDPNGRARITETICCLVEVAESKRAVPHGRLARAGLDAAITSLFGVDEPSGG